jgi:hypothetical protein
VIVQSRDRLRALRFGENGFAFDPATGLTYTLSATSLRIIAWLLEGCPEEELASRLVAEYDASSRTAVRDIDNFLVSMRGFKLL